MPMICFDLEGPLSPQDNAYEVLALTENGHKVFEVISKYDDILALEGREDYEPGDTLKLIAPFLIHHGITEEDIKAVSSRARIVPGTKEVVSELNSDGWKVYIISTSYQQHALNIGEQIGIPKERIACTRFPLDAYAAELGVEDFTLVKDIEGEILNDLYPKMEEDEIKRVLDDFFFEKLIKTRLGKIFEKISVVGGKRKVDALEKFAQENGKELHELVVVGDSITDFKMLKVVKEKGGVAIVFNGNEYAIPYANVSLATPDQRALLAITSAFARGGKEEAIEVAKVLEERGLEGAPESMVPRSIRDVLSQGAIRSMPPKFHCLEDVSKEKIEEVIRIHKNMRMYMRGAAGKLG
ncbi:MAG: HAD family hydrolase [Candidatus Hydrothermarchaeales archaeon]